MNLYKMIGSKRKSSVLKSVTVTDNYCEGARIIEVEPYDQTGNNALDTTMDKYDAAQTTIEKALHKVLPNELVRVCVYSNKFDAFEYLFNTKYETDGSFKC